VFDSAHGTAHHDNSNPNKNFTLDTGIVLPHFNEVQIYRLTLGFLLY
jgi:hypothetical protein